MKVEKFSLSVLSNKLANALLFKRTDLYQDFSILNSESKYDQEIPQSHT